MLTINQIEDCLGFDPYSDDLGECDFREFSDKIVKTKKEANCFNCGGIIPARSHSRVIKILLEGEFHTARWCERCCLLMARMRNPINNSDYTSAFNEYEHLISIMLNNRDQAGML